MPAAPPDWSDQVDIFIRGFAERARDWERHPGDLEDRTKAEPWTNPDRPDPMLDAAYRSGIVPPERRSDFIRPVDVALDYALRLGWPVFPCQWQGARRKQPLIANGFKSASRDPQQIRSWWMRGREALIGVPTGRASGIVVLDIDTKDPTANGFDTLAKLGKSVLPETPMAHTASGGRHVYFATIEIEIRNSIGEAGLGPGLDVRGEGGYVIVSSPGSGYSWDPVCNFDTVSLRPAPAWLGHRTKKKATSRRREPGERFDPQKALDDSCSNIRNAKGGDKYRTVRREAFIVACLVRDKLLDGETARHALEAALKALERQADDADHMWNAADGAWDEGLAASAARRARR
jgi:hypothetical protein